MKILVIIPMYNEEENVQSVIESLGTIGDEIDYIVINDCSKDQTLHILEEINANYIDLPVNLGIGGGMQCGYLYALKNDYDIAIQLDGDGQHDPNYIKTIVKPILDGQADFVIGSRFIDKKGFQSSGARRMGIRLLSRLIKFSCKTQVYDVTSGFRAVNKKVIQMFANNYAQDYPEPEAIVAAVMNGARIKEVPVIMHERIGGESSINAWKPIYYMIKVSIAILLYRLSFNSKEINI